MIIDEKMATVAGRRGRTAEDLQGIVARHRSSTTRIGVVIDSGGGPFGRSREGSRSWATLARTPPTSSSHSSFFSGCTRQPRCWSWMAVVTIFVLGFLLLSMHIVWRLLNLNGDGLLDQLTPVRGYAKPVFVRSVITWHQIKYQGRRHFDEIHHHDDGDDGLQKIEDGEKGKVRVERKKKQIGDGGRNERRDNNLSERYPSRFKGLDRDRKLVGDVSTWNKLEKKKMTKKKGLADVEANDDGDDSEHVIRGGMEKRGEESFRLGQGADDQKPLKNLKEERVDGQLGMMKHERALSERSSKNMGQRVDERNEPKFEIRLQEVRQEMETGIDQDQSLDIANKQREMNLTRQNTSTIPVEEMVMFDFDSNKKTMKLKKRDDDDDDADGRRLDKSEKEDDHGVLAERASNRSESSIGDSERAAAGESDSHHCATFEEMGKVTEGKTRGASLRVRSLIESHLKEHGAETLRSLSAAAFCEQGFVMAKVQEDGIGNSVYKILTAFGIAMMFNRSVILGELGSTQADYLGPIGGGDARDLWPFHTYIEYSNELFTMQEVKVLWARHGCENRFGRPLVMRKDPYRSLNLTTSLCHDWTEWKIPIIWYQDTTDANGIQRLLKNCHASMRHRAESLLGSTSDPDSRPNVFGELMRALIRPTQLVREAIDWALKGRGDVDLTMHFRMQGHRLLEVLQTAASCAKLAMEVSSSSSSSSSTLTSSVNATGGPDNLEPFGGKSGKQIDQGIRRVTFEDGKASAGERRLRSFKFLKQRELDFMPRPRIVVVSDTPVIVEKMIVLLSSFADVVYFNHTEYIAAHPNSNLFQSNAGLVPAQLREADWGPNPYWASVVDFFLAASASRGYVTAAHQRVGTTFSQLTAAYAAAHASYENFHLYSSFHGTLLQHHFEKRMGRSHTWHTFGGPLRCRDQGSQCARTALMPYSWWDGPLQSARGRDLHRLHVLGIMIGSKGELASETVEEYCSNKAFFGYDDVTLTLPSVT